MATQSTVVVGGAVEGNIGSCEVKSTSVSLDSWHTQTLAVNSCTGEVVSNNSYYDWSYIYFPVMIVFVIVTILVFVRGIFD